MIIYYTDIYNKWFRKLKDKVAKVTISRRIEMIEKHGHLGDVRFIGESVYEIRIHHGAGYRVYFHKRDYEVIILLCGGDKSNQEKDIILAKELVKEV